ncbi:MAG TPA: tetratricopeptide repeat protein [Planctomycetaceae bacterium]|nr:tetratricopeptide repeat protein [Planctomycetaceae bacterium]
MKSYSRLVCLAVLVFSNSFVAAQPKVLPRQPNGLPVPVPAQVNPAHEKAKRDAEQAYTEGKYNTVITLMETVIRQNPRDDVALYLRGSARIEEGVQQNNQKLIRDGISDSRQSILYDKKGEAIYYLPYLYGMTNLTLMEGKPQHATVSVQVATSSLQDSKLKGQDKANLLYQRAFAHQALKKFDEAAKDYQAAIAEFPAHLGAHVALAETYLQDNKEAQALAAFEAAVKTFPNSALIYNNRGTHFQQKGDFDKAILDFTQALREDPNYYHSYTNRAYCLMEQGKASAAEIDYTDSLKRNDRQSNVYSLRAIARLAQGKAAEAAEDYQAIIRLEPNNAVAWGDLGFARFFNKDYQGAFDAFSAAVKLSDELRYVDSWRYLALTKSGKEAQAKALFANSLNKIPVQRDWIDSLIAYQAGAIEMGGLLAAVDKTDPEIRKIQECEAQFFAGQLLIAKGEAQKAGEHFRNAIGTNLKHLSVYRGSRYELQEFSQTAVQPLPKIN